MSEPKSIPLPSRDAVTSMQIDSLLRVAGTMSSLLFHLAPPSEDDAARVARNDGGVTSSVEATLMGVCARLDDVLADSDRWNLKSQGKLEKQLAEVYAANLKLLRLQSVTMQAMLRPHRRFNPTLVQLDGGQWAAVLGDMLKGTPVVGSGPTPEAAMDDFDKVYLGKSKNSVILPTNEDHLDTTANPTVDEPPQAGQEERGGSQNNGEDGGSSPNPIQ